jgi:hypothetical protein
MSDTPIDPPAEPSVERPLIYPRKWERLEARLRKLRGPPTPDLTGWKPEKVLLWAARNKKYEELLKLAHKGDRPTIATAVEREPDPPAPGDTPAAEPPEQPAEPHAAEPSSAEQATSPATTEPPAPPPEQAASAEPGETPKSPEWWEERARWRFRTAEDYAEWEKSPEVEHNYDPLKDA